MKRNLEIIMASPAGNRTIFVLSKVEREDYGEVGKQLLAMEELAGEQVGFVLSENEMEMCGLEFCGNASRAFGFMVAKNPECKLEATGPEIVEIKVSGSDAPLRVEVDLSLDYAKIEMPLPYQALELCINSEGKVTNLKGDTVNIYNSNPNIFNNTNAFPILIFEGICHAVLIDIPFSQELYDALLEYLKATFDIPAIGIMFYDSKTNHLMPVVYVEAVDSTYFEGSCASGTIALALILSQNLSKNKSHSNESCSFEIHEPAGSLEAQIIKENGVPVKCFIGGSVGLEDPIRVQID